MQHANMCCSLGEPHCSLADSLHICGTKALQHKCRSNSEMEQLRDISMTFHTHPAAGHYNVVGKYRISHTRYPHTHASSGKRHRALAVTQICSNSEMVQWSNFVPSNAKLEICTHVRSWTLNEGVSLE